MLATLSHARDGHSPRPWLEFGNHGGQTAARAWVRAADDSALREYRTRLELDHGLLDVFGALMDLERYPQWLFRCAEARTLPGAGPDTYWMRIGHRWPVHDRDVVFRTHIHQDPLDLSVTVTWEAVPSSHRAPERVVRVASMRTTFFLEPLAEDRVRVTLDTFIDPGGRVPVWLANRDGARTGPESLSGLRRFLAQEHHQLDSVEQLRRVPPGIDEFVFPDRAPTPATPRLDEEAEPQTSVALSQVAPRARGLFQPDVAAP